MTFFTWSVDYYREDGRNLDGLLNSMHGPHMMVPICDLLHLAKNSFPTPLMDYHNTDEFRDIRTGSESPTAVPWKASQSQHDSQRSYMEAFMEGWCTVLVKDSPPIDRVACTHRNRTVRWICTNCEYRGAFATFPRKSSCLSAARTQWAK
jgi:hypothetical protein